MDNEFIEAIDNIVTSFQAERLSAERAMASVAALLADRESGTDV